MAPFAAGERVYLSLPGPGEDAASTRRTFGPTYDPLPAIKRAWDLGNVFRFNQNIDQVG